MTDIEPKPRCRFCGGPLARDREREEQQQVVKFRFYRCQRCAMPNVFAVDEDELDF